LEDRVTFTGALGREGVLRALSECSFVVTPSVWYENCPYSVMEALAAGRPVVASDIGGLPELVVEGEDGLIVPPGDPVALAAAMKTLWEDPQLQKRLSAEAVRASSEFGRGSYYRRLIGVYESAGSRSATRDGGSATWTPQ
jgi:glycosyltransferase involved in cell wall biosynthesis